MNERPVQPPPRDLHRAGRRRAVLCALLAVLGTPVAFAADAASPGREFSATFDFKGAQGNRRMDASILIDRFTPVEEARQLREVLKNQGQHGLLTALRDRRNGRLRLGALDFSLDLVVAKPREDGFLLLIITTRPIRLQETVEPSNAADYPFGVVSVEIDGFGRGEGKFFPRSALAIDADGNVTVQQSVEGEGRVTQVKKVR
jgi:hypothetical protein